MERVGWLDEDNVYFYTFVDGAPTGQKGAQGTDEVITMTNELVTNSEKIWSFPLEVGKQWTYRQVYYPRGGGRMMIETHQREVVGCELVQTPAGSFPAMKILDSTTSESTITYFVWYAPALKHVVKREYIEGSPRSMTADEPQAELIRYTLK